MLPLRDTRLRSGLPLVTYTLIALNVLIYLWDRNWRIFGGSVIFPDLTMRPQEVVAVLQGAGDRWAPITLLTSLFLHGSLMHIFGNMIFLLVFGAGVEEAIGSPRFAFYYFFWGLAASATHIFVDPHSMVPVLGASGAIGGVLGCYFLLFPSNKIEVFVPILAFLSFEVAAWILLGVWFAMQILFPQEGVANWAHAGGFLAGMLTVLILGGRAKLLKNLPPEPDAIA